jgi:hypothetical protein
MEHSATTSTGQEHVSSDKVPSAKLQSLTKSGIDQGLHKRLSLRSVQLYLPGPEEFSSISQLLRKKYRCQIPHSITLPTFLTNDTKREIRDSAV